MHRRIATLAVFGLALLAGTADAQSRRGATDGAPGGAAGSGSAIGRTDGGSGTRANAEIGRPGTMGGAGGATDGAGTGGEIGGLLTDPSAVFGIQRGATIGGADAGATTIGGGNAAAAAPSATSRMGGAFGGGLGGGFGGMGGLGGMFGGLNPFGTGAESKESTPVRTRLRSAIRVAPMPPQQVQARIQQQLVNTPAAARFLGAQVRMDGRTAILTGQVSSDEDRRMAEMLIQLEPGVSRIENNLTVGQPEIMPSPSDSMLLPQP